MKPFSRAVFGVCLLGLSGLLPATAVRATEERFTLPAEMTACQTDAECVVAPVTACLSCRWQGVMNKNYAPEFAGLEKAYLSSVGMDTAACEACQKRSQNPRCVHNQCVADWNGPQGVQTAGEWPHS